VSSDSSEAKNPEGSSSGFLEYLRSFAQSLLGSVQNRFELLGTELQEEKFRLIQIFIWISAATFCGVMTLAFASFALVYLFWESARLPVLLGLTAFYAIGFTVILLKFRAYLARQPKPFASTIAELEKDRACIRPTN